jgi:hypothetical protein
MLYVITNILLKVVFNTNKTMVTILIGINATVNTFNNVSRITYNIVTSFIGV